MEKMNQAFEKMKMMVGMEDEDAELQQQQSSFIGDFDRNCTLSTKQVCMYVCIIQSNTWLIICIHIAIFEFSIILMHFSERFILFNYFSRQRMYGFAICLASGISCTLLSMLVFFNPVKFGITFSFGNLLALGSTGFLIGPKRQVTMMLDPVRIYATAIYIASIIVALFCAVYVRNKLLTLLAIVLEFGALIWYSLSYIPFARSMVSKIMVACFDTEF
ncbi:hypothetical protein BUALT_Bualt04G0001600 [Buddleja alternifolia]|uniref:Vesicle transport protein n=1 Tax=Buddleja alternifolia TaxID=168488 RepID=A0AAV6XW22_9LAMI|nr:hypothetical protein BUALT_Bualt04G0001600 [Buddleja alternifolia]